MSSKLYTIIFLFILSFFSTQAQMVLHHKTKNKVVDLPLNQKISFQLLSDSTLGVQTSDDYGVLVTFTDSALVFDDNRSINFSDFKFLKIHPKERYKARVIASPFVVLGAAITLRGLVMTFGEGLESKNKVTAPLYVLVGGVITTVSSIPFWGTAKKYQLNSENWQLTSKNSLNQ